MKQAHYTIKTSTGDIPLLFHTKTYKEYTRKKGIEQEDLEMAIRAGQSYKANDAPEVLLIAHQIWCMYNNKEFTQTELDACDWLDEMGGWRSEKMLEIWKIFTCNFFNMDPAQFELVWNAATTIDQDKAEKLKEEKKKAQVRNLPGGGSTNTQRKLA